MRKIWLLYPDFCCVVPTSGPCAGIRRHAESASSSAHFFLTHSLAGGTGTTLFKASYQQAHNPDCSKCHWVHHLLRRVWCWCCYPGGAERLFSSPVYCDCLNRCKFGGRSALSSVRTDTYCSRILCYTAAHLGVQEQCISDWHTS